MFMLLLFVSKISSSALTRVGNVSSCIPVSGFSTDVLIISFLSPSGDPEHASFDSFLLHNIKSGRSVSDWLGLLLLLVVDGDSSCTFSSAVLLTVSFKFDEVGTWDNDDMLDDWSFCH